MNAETSAALASIARRGTRYEVVATHSDGRTVAVGFLLRRSRSGLLRLMRSRADHLIGALGIGESDMMTFADSRADHPVAKVAGWRIALSGRTQREAIIGAC